MIASHDLWYRPRRVARVPGLRAGSLPDVKLVGGAGPFEVDVLIRVLPDASIEISGQVTGGERLHEPVARLPVRLFDADALACLGTTTTDAFGEFVLAHVDAGRYVLALGSGTNAPVMEIWDGGEHGARCATPL